MLKEITAPSSYTGTIEEENSILEGINNNFMELEKDISDLSQESSVFEKHIVDFEQYEIDVYFETNLKKATIAVTDNNIEIRIGDNIVRIDADGNVV